jgi:hypothetical protein
MVKRIHPTRWLWTTAFYALLLGAAAVCLMYYTMPGPRTLTPEIRMVIMASVVAAGICVISATAHWWIRR